MSINELLERQDQIQDELDYCECGHQAQALMNEHYAIDTALALLQDQSEFITTT